MRKSKSLTFFSLYLVYTLDLLGLVLVYVIFPPLILNPESKMVDSNFLLSTRNLIIGLLLGTYPFTQFFAAPILGDLSDRFGRKKILLISTFGTIVCFAFSAMAIYLNHLILLFISRLMSGIFSGNLTVAQAAVANIAPDKKKPQYMANFSTVGGCAWTIGPFLGVLLSNSNLISFFSYATPFWFLSILFFINFLLFILSSIDKIKDKKEQKLHLLKVAPNLLNVLKLKKIRPLFLCSIFTLIAWMMYQGFLAPYLIEKYAFTKTSEGYAYAFSSVFWFLGGLFSSRYLLKHHSAKRQIIAPMFLCSLSILSFLIAFKNFSIWILLAIANSSQAVITACFFSLFAHYLPKNKQGKIFGLWNAGMAFASFFGPLTSSLLVGIEINLPYTLAALILFATTLYYLKWYKNFSNQLS